MDRSTLTRTMVSILILLTSGLAPAAADRIVLRDGTEIETAGPWRVESSRVLFEQPNGTFSSLRLSEVDLEASREATAAAENPEPEKEESEKEPREPVLVLTDEDIPTYRIPPGSEEEEAPPGEPSATQNGLRVVDWRAEVGPEGMEITGRIENTTSSERSAVRLVVKVFERPGEPPVASAPATVGRRVIRGGESTEFRVHLDDVYEIDGEVAFELDSQSFVIHDRSTGAPSPAGGAARSEG